MVDAEAILDFWLREISQKDWYVQKDLLDDAIRDRFGDTWQAALDGTLNHWLTSPREALGFIILTDQFPRNMFRGSGQSFASDEIALAAAKKAIARGWDMRIAEPARQFFFMPLMHSESLCDQDRCVRLFLTRMPESGGNNLLHARAHREVIRRFGRFPFRNAALGRMSRDGETDFMENGGYGAAVKALKVA